MAKSRLKNLTLESGEVIKIPPVSQIALTQQIKRENPPPEPPWVEVEIGGEKMVERNYADPAYDVALDKWGQFIPLEVTERVLWRVAIQQKLTDERQADVNELREAVGDNEQLPTSDKALWLTQIACNDADITAILKAASNMADPSEKGVKAAADNFQDDVPGA